MPTHPPRDTEKWTPLLILAAGLFLLILLWRILLVFILAAFFAFIINPVVEIFDRKLPRIYSIMSVYLILTIIAVLIAGLVAPTISRQMDALVKATPTYLAESQRLIDSTYVKYLDLPERWKVVIDTALEELRALAVKVAPQVVPAAFSFFAGLVTLLFVPLLALFMLLDTSGYRNMMLAVAPGRYRRTMSNLMSCTSRILWNYTKGRLLIMFFIGLMVGLGLYLVGMPYAAVFGIFAAFLEAVPTLGPIVTTVVISLIALAISPVLALEVTLVTVSIQLIENLFLSPYIMAKTIGLDPVTVLFALFLGGSIAGILGALIAVPVAMIMKIVILYFYVKDGALVDKQAAVCKPTAPKGTHGAAH